MQEAHDLQRHHDDLGQRQGEAARKWKPSRARYGTCQAPKKSVVASAETTTISAKSLIMNVACLLPEYSVK